MIRVHTGPSLSKVRKFEEAVLAEQSYKSHTRFDPPLHFFVLPLLLVNIATAGYAAIHSSGAFYRLSLWWILIGVVLVVMAGTLRGEALRVQDRVIRLEERQRLAELLSPAEMEVARGLTVRQLVALRFAPDAELPGLAVRAAREGMDAKGIKQAIVNWRADLHRA